MCTEVDGKVRQNEEKIHSDFRLRYVFKFILLSEGILPVFWLKPEEKKRFFFKFIQIIMAFSDIGLVRSGRDL